LGFLLVGNGCDIHKIAVFSTMVGENNAFL